jgi:hypothetical protein
MKPSRVSPKPGGFAALCLWFGAMIFLPARGLNAAEGTPETWPQGYEFRTDDAARTDTLSTPYYRVTHDLNRGGAISLISYTYGKSENLLKTPLACGARIAGEEPGSFTDANCPAPVVKHEKSSDADVLTVECPLMGGHNSHSGILVRTRYEYRWGYIKIHRTFTFTKAIELRELNVLSSVLDPSFTDYGYRENIFEQQGVSPSSFGVCEWGKMRAGSHFDTPVQRRFLPRYVVFLNPGIEGIEWFVSSNLAQWDYQLSQHQGIGYFGISASMSPLGVALSIDPLNLARGSIKMEAGSSVAFDYYIGMPILKGHANKPWLHTSFNRNRGDWVSEEQISNWAKSGIRTVHCHNDGDAYDDGLFWRDGTYPPYPPEDMKKYDRVLELCRKYGIRTATYFSNKELHPVTEAYKEHGEEWGRKPDDTGMLYHNRYRNDEFGVQMCLKSGWLKHLEFTIDRVLTNHKLDGVYYDWNVALYCNNPLHVGQSSNGIAPQDAVGALALSKAGHWDMDELLQLMEWTRKRVGPEGLIILHNTMAPMFATENFADYVVGMEWGYGMLLTGIPPVSDLPAEWNFAGARSRAVIGYGTLAPEAPESLSRLQALQTLLTGVAPWPASPEAIELYRLLRPIGNVESCKFEDWRSGAVSALDNDCVPAVYSRPGEAYIIAGNLSGSQKDVRIKLDCARLPYALKGIRSSRVFDGNRWMEINAGAQGTVDVTIPARGAVLLNIAD